MNKSRRNPVKRVRTQQQLVRPRENSLKLGKTTLKPWKKNSVKLGKSLSPWVWISNLGLPQNVENPPKKETQQNLFIWLMTSKLTQELIWFFGVFFIKAYATLLTTNYRELETAISKSLDGKDIASFLNSISIGPTRR